MYRFADLKMGFQQILSDPHWVTKILLGGFLLINPFLVALGPAYFSEVAKPCVRVLFLWILGLNILTFWFPLGFTLEVLRHARNGQAGPLPDWKWNLLLRYAQEGAVKFVVALTTLLLPLGLWLGFIHLIFIRSLGLPPSFIPLFAGITVWFFLPFCGVACCRWLDGTSLLSCALNYPENWRLFRKGLPDYLLASAFLMGINTLTTSFFYTIPFAVIFGLCLVDAWFGAIYAETVQNLSQKSER